MWGISKFADLNGKRYGSLFHLILCHFLVFDVKDIFTETEGFLKGQNFLLRLALWQKSRYVVQFETTVPAHIKSKVFGKVEPLYLSLNRSWLFTKFRRESVIKSR